MIINHNISALGANRVFSNNVQKMDKNIEKLSTGQRINKGADDAAGLAVSEKMRGQIRGLNQASRNIQDTVSLIQTTEGFLKQTNDAVHRMRELAVQGANGTYTSEDRAQMMVEMDEMIKEINRIHEDAKFNTVRLLDGKSTGFNSFGVASAAAEGSLQPNLTNPDNTVALARNTNFNIEDGQVALSGNGVVVQSGANTDERMFLRLEKFDSNTLGLTDQPNQQYADVANPNYGSTNMNQAWRENSFYNTEAQDLQSALYLESGLSNPAAIEGGVNINLMNPIQEGRGVNRVDLTTSEKATETIAVLDVALNKVNKQRADLGAFQNRLEMAGQGVDTAAENMQAAESRIRDTDMAKEFVEFTKNQILGQSSASMTAQANMGSQLVMRILG